MNAEILQRAFKKMGAQIQVNKPGRRGLPRGTGAHRINILGETFDLLLGQGAKADVLDVQPKQRHLLLQVMGADTKKYLCGHDERHWFVAGVKQEARSVEHAMKLLQPPEVRQAIAETHIKHNQQFLRRNAAYVRQGEWFFVPAPDLRITGQQVVHNHEPIRRGASKPHMVEWVYRRGGTRVMPCRHYPNGLTDEQWKESMAKQLDDYIDTPRNRWDKRGHGDHCGRMNRWMTRDAEVYGKGKVSHPDHATIKLVGWHRIYLSNEVVDRQFQAFLD